MDVSENSGFPPKSSILIVVSIIFAINFEVPFLETPFFFRRGNVVKAGDVQIPKFTRFESSRLPPSTTLIDGTKTDVNWLVGYTLPVNMAIAGKSLVLNRRYIFTW